MSQTIRKAVIPAAGFGTRFLPATKSQPKEMLPIVDTPVIQHVIEELAAVGVRDVVMVIGRGKRAIEEHFDRSFQLETQLQQKGRTEDLKKLRAISDLVDIHFVWQKEQLGLGHAVYCARHHVNDEPFLVLLGDTLIDSPEPASQRVLDVFDRYQEPVVMLEEVPEKLVCRYGIADAREIEPDVFQISDFIEKPTPQETPSHLAIASRYAFTPDIFNYLEKITPGKGGELQLTDAMRLMARDRAMYGVRLQGRRCDIGNKLGFIKANITFGLKQPDIADALKEYLRELIKD